jgi:hypothetical protein
LRNWWHVYNDDASWCCYRETASAEEFEELVQRLLAANSGFSWQHFADFLTTIINRRLATARQQQQQVQRSVEPRQQDEEQQHATQHEGHVQQQHQQGLRQKVCRPADAGAAGTGTTAGGLTSSTAAAADDSERRPAQTAAAADCALHTQMQMQVQMLHCALDLQRAGSVLQQVQQAYVAAAAHNTAWCDKHSSSRQFAGQQQHGQQASVTSISSCSPIRQTGDGGAALPAWLLDAAGLARLALQVAEQLQLLCEMDSI